MVLQEPKEPKFKVGDLVVMFWQDFEGTVVNDDPRPNAVIGIRADATGPHPVYTLLHPDGSTRVRYEFELKAMKCDEPMHNVTHQS